MVIPSPSPRAQGNILYGVAALSDTDVWAVVQALDPNGIGNALYALDAVSSTSVYAVGQTPLSPL